jgi:hypothetical protein
MELASDQNGRQPGCLSMAGNPFVYTIARVAEMLGEDEDWLLEISVAMDPEEGHLWLFGTGGEETPAFTAYGIQCLKQIIIEERNSSHANPNRARST